MSKVIDLIHEAMEVYEAKQKICLNASRSLIELKKMILKGNTSPEVLTRFIDEIRERLETV